MLAKDPSLIFRRWFALRAAVKAVLFEVIKPRKQRNCQLETITHSLGQTRVQHNLLD